MADNPASSRAKRAFPVRVVFEDYNAAAITAATLKKEWIAPCDLRILDVIVDSETAGSGGTSDIVDVNINGTTIYTTQANRPTLLVTNTGMFAEAGEPEVFEIKAGDIISYDVDQIATTGSARFKIAIVCGLPR
jgi:hypothetical protein